MAHYRIAFEESTELWEFDAPCLTRERIMSALHSSIFNLFYFATRDENGIRSERTFIYRDGKVVCTLLALLHETYPAGSLLAQTFYWPSGRLGVSHERVWKVKGDRIEGVHI